MVIFHSYVSLQRVPPSSFDVGCPQSFEVNQTREGMPVMPTGSSSSVPNDVARRYAPVSSMMSLIRVEHC